MAVIKTLDLRAKNLSKSDYKELMPRAEFDIDAALAAIKPILNAVETGDENTLKKLAKKY